jgi:hypothetical protein
MRHDDDGSFYEYAWSSLDGQNVMAARNAALLALSRDDLPGDWVVITCEIAWSLRLATKFAADGVCLRRSRSERY